MTRASLRASLRDIVAAAGAVKAARKRTPLGERLNPIAEMLDCLRLAHRWAAAYEVRASVAAELAAAWANDAIKQEE